MVIQKVSGRSLRLLVKMSKLIPKHGGYQSLLSFQVAQLVYDITVRFCDRYIDRFSRTKDQMVQAARSGVQNIAEGSQASATSKKTELKLTQVARASLEELKLDYRDFLRQRGLSEWDRQNPLRQQLIDRRCKTADEVANWIMEVVERGCGQSGQGGQCDDRQSTLSTQSTRSTKLYPDYSANAALVLIAVACSLLDRQVERLAQDFEKEGGFTERLYRVRSEARSRTQNRKR
jgi:four helix bundle suffix protein